MLVIYTVVEDSNVFSNSFDYSAEFNEETIFKRIQADGMGNPTEIFCVENDSLTHWYSSNGEWSHF